VTKGNPCHKPAGSSTGGQFCETGGSSGDNHIAIISSGPRTERLSAAITEVFEALPTSWKPVPLEVRLHDDPQSGHLAQYNSASKVVDVWPVRPTTNAKGYYVRNREGVGGTVLHEYGHAVDYAGVKVTSTATQGRHSGSEGFQKALQTDKTVSDVRRTRDLGESDWRGFGHVVSHPREVFAETYAILAAEKTGGKVFAGSSLEDWQRHFPQTLSYVSSIFEGKK
jgi:hypothetical protein